jgi:plastocyanin
MKTPVSRILATVAVIAAAALTLASVGSAAAAPKPVAGSVGPGFTISLKFQGKKVSKLKAGVAYRFTVNDRSSIHDFHVTGPGVNKVITGVGFTGTKSTVLKLKKGTYRYVCDPHSSSMKGTFTVS